MFLNKDKKQYTEALVQILALAVSADKKITETEIKTVETIFSMDDFVEDKDSALKNFNSRKSELLSKKDSLEPIYALISQQIIVSVRKINNASLCDRLELQLKTNWKSNNKLLEEIKSHLVNEISRHKSELNENSNPSDISKKANNKENKPEQKKDKSPKYSLRTCAVCGIKKPVNELSSKTVRKELARGRSGVSFMTFLGFGLGDSGSKSAVKRWFFNSSQRNYSAKKEVLVCRSCKTKINLLGSNSGCFGKIFRAYIYLMLIVMVGLLIENLYGRFNNLFN
jgi:hypothetical protein